MNLFFELLQVAIGNRQSLYRVASPEEWEEIYEMSKKQAVAGIAFAGVERLPQEQMPPGRRIRQWAVKAEKTREHNAKVSEDCRVISRFFEENGFDCVILKGQGNFAYYPEWLQGLRSAGDIDVWALPKSKIDGNGNVNVNPLNSGTIEPLNFMNHPVRSVIEFCLSKKRGEYVYYHNLDFPVLKKTPVEVHYRPTWLYNPFRNRVLQKWFGQFTVHNSQFTVHNSRLASVAPAVRPITQFAVYDGYRIPSVEFNVVFQLLHLYKHIFEEGIGLRQLLDYYFVVKKFNETLRYEDEMQSEIATKRGYATTITKLGLWKFAGAVMYVMREVFAMPEEMMLCKPDRKRGRKLLNEIMQGGNFGKFDARYNWAETTNGSMDYRGVSYAFARLRHNFQFLSDYPSEVLWEPLFRVYHWFWRRCRLWRWE